MYAEEKLSQEFSVVGQTCIIVTLSDFEKLTNFRSSRVGWKGFSEKLSVVWGAVRWGPSFSHWSSSHPPHARKRILFVCPEMSG